jgi:hypothetical protein
MLKRQKTSFSETWVNIFTYKKDVIFWKTGIENEKFSLKSVLIHWLSNALHNSSLIAPVFLKLLNDIRCLGSFRVAPKSKGEIPKTRF